MICAMEKRYALHEMRVDDWVANSLEAEANRMPPSYKEQADILRQQAQNFRNSSNPKTVHFWQEVD
jgi:hypothetical protein